jgi:energy-coupling factor transporter ATP-binding protein EcfA2
VPNDSPSSSDTVIKVSGLSFSYYGSSGRSLQDVNLSIQRGEIVLIAGHSGSGKSTLLRCLNGLIPHQHSGTYEGQVSVGGMIVSKSKMSELAKKVGYVFQNPENQIFMFSVERDIAFGLENLAVDREEIRRRVDESLTLLGIKDLALRAPHELSDGQKQRVAIAGVLVLKPQILILDEPTSLLDSFTARELVQLVLNLRGKLMMTVLIVEHRLDLLAKIATRIVILNEGRIVSDGPPRKILSEMDVGVHGVTEPTMVRLAKLLKLKRADDSFPVDVSEVSEALQAEK